MSRLADRALRLLGLSFDFDIDMKRQALSEITDTLFVGRRPRCDEASALKDVGITHVVSCLPESARDSVSFLGNDFGWLFTPLRDDLCEDITARFDEVFAFADQATRETERAKLLIHCEVGVSRSATLAVALVMRSQTTTFLAAFRQVRARRPEVLPNIAFASQLQQLEFAQQPERRHSREPSSLALYLKEICNAPVDVPALQAALEHHDYDAPRALRSIFGDEIPRVVQGVRR